MADGFAQKEKGVFQGEGLFSLVHEPFALLVIDPNSLVKGIGAPCPGRPNPLGHWFGVVLFVEPYFRPILLI